MKQDDIEQLAAIRLNHSAVVSSHPCSEASCEQAFLLRLLDEQEIESKMADHKWFDHQCQAKGCQSLVIAQAIRNRAELIILRKRDEFAPDRDGIFTELRDEINWNMLNELAKEIHEIPELPE